MVKNKYDFINEILGDKKINQNQREKILELASKEISFEGTLEERVKRIEDIISNNPPGNKHPEVENPDQENTKYNKIHSPKGMIKFLYNFSSNENFKWLTHEPDLKTDDINYISLLQNTKRELKSYNLNIATFRFIESFVNKESFEVFYPHSINNLSYGNKKIEEQLEKGANPFELKIEGVYFKDIINNFKRAIEFRLDAGDRYKFSYLFRDFIANNLSVDVIENYSEQFKKSAKTLTTYIDVNNFFKGLKIIIDWINGYKTLSNNIQIDLVEEDDSYSLIIFHKQSYISHDIQSEKLKGRSGHFETLRKYWFNVVDFKISADFKDKNSLNPHTIVALNERTQIIVTNDNKYLLSENEFLGETENVGGVKYFITIFKTKNL